MEIIGVIPLIGFLIFIVQISFFYRKLNTKNIIITRPRNRKKTLFTLIFLILFMMVFTTELFIQSSWSEFSFLPQILQYKLYQSDVFAVIGVLLIILSNVTVYLSFKSFSNSFRFGLNSKSLGKLITSGVLAHSRNPFFVSIILHFTGIALVLPTMFFVAIAGLSILSIHFYILKEERFMRENYGEEYIKYTQKVRRYF